MTKQRHSHPIAESKKLFRLYEAARTARYDAWHNGVAGDPAAHAAADAVVAEFTDALIADGYRVSMTDSRGKPCEWKGRYETVKISADRFYAASLTRSALDEHKRRLEIEDRNDR